MKKDIIFEGRSGSLTFTNNIEEAAQLAVSQNGFFYSKGNQELKRYLTENVDLGKGEMKLLGYIVIEENEDTFTVDLYKQTKHGIFVDRVEFSRAQSEQVSREIIINSIIQKF